MKKKAVTKIFCGFLMKNVTRNDCLHCSQDGAPSNCKYKDGKGKQTRLEGF